MGEEFACDRTDEAYLNSHILGNPVANKQRAYTVDEYRRKWTKSAPEIVAAGAQDTSEHRTAYKTPDLRKLDPTICGQATSDPGTSHAMCTCATFLALPSCMIAVRGSSGAFAREQDT